MGFKAIFTFTLAMLLIACGSEKRSENTFTGNQWDPNQTPRESIVVRTNKRTGQAQFAVADFSTVNDRKELAQLGANIDNWQPIPPSQTIKNDSGYPRAQNGNVYFVRDVSKFSPQPAQSSSNNSIRGMVDPGFGVPANFGNQFYGYAGFPYYGGYGASYYHYYPGYANMYGSYANYYYQPVLYNNSAWVYLNPCYYNNSGAYTYNYYTYWW